MYVIFEINYVKFNILKIKKILIKKAHQKSWCLFILTEKEVKHYFSTNHV